MSNRTETKWRRKNQANYINVGTNGNTAAVFMILHFGALEDDDSEVNKQRRIFFPFIKEELKKWKYMFASTQL